MDAAYDNTYHHNLRGRIWQALEGTRFDERHDAERPLGVSFSNPFPPREMHAGDERTLLVAAAEEDLLRYVAEDLIADRELNIGEMPFRVTEMMSLDPDVGEPGTTGQIETGTGVLVRIPTHRFDEYGIDIDSDHPAYWRPEYTMKPFKRQIENNLDRKHDYFAPEPRPGPSDVDGDLFDSYELLKTFAIPVTVTQGQELTYVLSKWTFGYRVRDDDHRRHLNLALDTGLGERNALGFGFCNLPSEGQ
jgi:CRISPR-associated endoribonuclease Cas6